MWDICLAPLASILKSTFFGVRFFWYVMLYIYMSSVDHSFHFLPNSHEKMLTSTDRQLSQTCGAIILRWKNLFPHVKLLLDLIIWSPNRSSPATATSFTNLRLQFQLSFFVVSFSMLILMWSRRCGCYVPIAAFHQTNTHLRPSTLY